MKNLVYFNFILLSFLFFSCDKDTTICHECHVLCAMDDGSSFEHEIGEFCGDALVDIEANGYTLTSEMTILGVTYPEGRFFSAMEICCEENHSGHDGHDH